MLKIDGQAMPSPGALEVSLEDISAAAERSAAGDAVRDYAGAKRRLKLRWPALTAGQLSALLQAVDACFFDAEYPDPVTGAAATVRCWCAARSTELMFMRGGAPVWNCEMEWMER